LLAQPHCAVKRVGLKKNLGVPAPRKQNRRSSHLRKYDLCRGAGGEQKLVKLETLPENKPLDPLGVGGEEKTSKGGNASALKTRLYRKVGITHKGGVDMEVYPGGRNQRKNF